MVIKRAKTKIVLNKKDQETARKLQDRTFKNINRFY